MPGSTTGIGRGRRDWGWDETSGQSWPGAEALVTKTGLHLPEFDSYRGSPFVTDDKP
ncbi:hypothetical protein [Nocardia sienata]|uniref:hypothetical protein n=1 Tax=Nocardia sienata TaxID=248552 RepID=UPI000A5BA7A4|nr:hypothetical protein [Nocardia sienata]